MKRKKLVGILLAAAVLFVMGCSQKEEDKDRSNTEQNQEDIDSEQSDSEQTDAEQSTEAEAIDETDQLENPDQADGNDISFHTYSWQEITVSIPDSWIGKYQVEEGEYGFSLIQTASFEKEKGMGFLCGFYRMDGTMVDIPGATPLAYTDTQTYYIGEPTDVSFYYEDEAISKEYHEMHDLVYAIAASISIAKEGVRYNPDEFVFPLSSTVLLTEDDLLNYSDNELAIARNEIYARHGRQFQDFYLSNYFASCSWYEGRVSPEAFDDAVLNQIEKDNIQIIKKAEETYKKEHPYPKAYQAGIKVEEDLDGDGKPEQLQYILEESDMDGTFHGTISINGRKFPLENYQDVWLDNPEQSFYVTDISPFFAGLEIAILDNGPSDDPVTYFFTYQGELTYIGSVGGYPFKQQAGYNGFANEGVVIGEIVLDFTHTCRAYGNWWYNSQEQKLEYQDIGYYNNKPDVSHQLYEDLTVYLKMDEGAITTRIPAQEEVFFMGTDGKEWVFIKGKDGSKGYVHIVDGKIAGLSKAPDEVFSGLGFSG